MKALILMHAPYEGAGSFGEVLRDNGATITTVRLYEEPDSPLSEQDHDLILSLGGLMDAGAEDGPSWLGRELEMLGRAARDGRKVLGVCLGAQLLARGLGAQMRPGTAAEIGFDPIELTEEGRDDPVLAGLKPTEPVLHWHGDTFDLPEKSVLLASSATTRNQAFRFGRYAYGLQFHLEMTRADLQEWFEQPAVLEELVAHGGNAEALLAQLEEHEKRLRWLCTSVLNRLLNLL